MLGFHPSGPKNPQRKIKYRVPNMSDRETPEWPAPARPAKRQKTDADLRRQRKREADRMAQKQSRERRRSHIDHLENMISILRKENGNAVTCELMETVLQLRAENERLRRIINSAKTSLSLAGCETSTTYYYPLQYLYEGALTHTIGVSEKITSTSPPTPRKRRGITIHEV
jgi:hypothetical protein